MTNGISRRDFLRIAGAGAATMVLPSAGLVEATAPKPNVVVILADDLGYCDTELYGCTTIPTPNLKRIAADGVTFTDGYVTNPVCSPSRAGLLTGCYQHRFGFEYNTGPIKRDHEMALGLTPGEVTLADSMKKAGYVTGMVGKWHLGTREQFHPVRRGFDEFFGFTFGGTDYIDPTRPDVRVIPKSRKNNKWKGRHPWSPIMRGTKVVEEEDYLTDAFSREAVSFINRHKKDPFFLYVPYNAPHTPLQATLTYYDRFPHIKDERKRIYAAMVSAMDDGIGTILDALEANGIEDNTMVFFLSDNGCALYTGACSNDPLRLGKLTQFDGGVRVPFCVKWPGRIPAGKTYTHPVSSLDIFPTALAPSNGTLPKDRPRDGVDLVPYLNGSRKDRPHDALFWRNGPNWAARQGDWKLFAGGGHYWLYDLSKDKGEMENVADKRPEIVSRIHAAYAEWNGQMIDPIWPARGIHPFKVDGKQVKWHI